MAQLIETGKKVVDNPTHLADFGAALTSGESQQLQAVLECTKVSVHDHHMTWYYMTIDSRTSHVDIGIVKEGISCCYFTTEAGKRGQWMDTAYNIK